MIHFVLLIGCAVAIYLSCEWFVNAVEWLGRRLKVGTVAVGTVLAAIGTALPESVVTFVAVAFGDTPEQRDLGVGAAMGGPLALATVAYGVIGWSLLASRRRGAVQDWGDVDKLAKDQTWFVVVFVVKVALGLVAFSIKPWLGLLFFAAYAVYCVREMRQRDDGPGEDLEPLKLQRRRAVPATWAVVAQTVGALAVIFAASRVFVLQLDAVGPMLGLPATLTALLLAPIATELPEIMNAVIWVRQGKTQLALANVSGSMMIQATVPSGFGLLFTPWRLDSALLVAGGVTLLAVVYLLITLRSGRLSVRRLSIVGAFYGLFAVALVPVFA
ncbi:sodium:calcium antiporter [Kibdelosporangium persicum]|uniref:Sodium/calcium exchanger membrane region n=1 Tax=Kibdelosporangium persicum TaxID=2698649 RepID=A0ABX2F262_9PSEU|nr:sodium:calcium antiporter [Kibdelosporangium persicum]NRN65395.1 Sodium/calcium exchanger membrane region [Kibdelosporangium persicum]